MTASLLCFSYWTHGVFDRNSARGVALRWKPKAVPIDDMILFNEGKMRRYTRAMIALNKGEPFTVCACNDSALVMYVLQSSPGGNGVTAILWGLDDTTEQRNAVEEFVTWHRSTYNIHVFPCASLEISDQKLFTP